MYFFLKRLFDIFFALVLIIISLPIMLPILIVLAFTGEKEVFYFQQRIGYKNQRFYIWKLSTMLKNSLQIGGEITLRNDPRVTYLGHYLRLSKLNEFPQLINILKGEMSFVGPRPLLDESFAHYSPQVQAHIYDSLPGITGIGSVIFRDEEMLLTKAQIPAQEYYEKYIMPHKGELEMWYQQKKSFFTDLMILYITVAVLFSPETTLPYKIFKGLPKRNF